ncbi:hypothetical protein IQ247_09630 [Plectonema cf. radiosum LEGE 06105]|uniref:Uncharacterized protein n=1 Tax=Plectonema cf. radiosum LEGE 06105 TaxID=945769 RepID=A0A8J7F7G5_9CYAN|nr:hypothetical protein [Plectonema radiosum]MBE9212944.1 hypothetical protein [Plectonema cf. radiosum LEGE 06105]
MNKDHSEEYKLWLNEQIALGLKELDSGKGLPAINARERICVKAQQLRQKNHVIQEKPD